jgi:hypothetical protein
VTSGGVWRHARDLTGLAKGFLALPPAARRGIRRRPPGGRAVSLPTREEPQAQRGDERMKPFESPPPSDVARAWHLCRELAALLGRIPEDRLGPLEDLPPLLEKVVAADRRPSPGASPHCGGKAAMHGAPGRAVSHLRKFRRCEARLGPSCGVSAAGGAIARCGYRQDEKFSEVDGGMTQ